MASITDRNFALVLGTSRSMVNDSSHSNFRFKISNRKESLPQCKYTHLCIYVTTHDLTDLPQGHRVSLSCGPLMTEDRFETTLRTPMLGKGRQPGDDEVNPCRCLLLVILLRSS